MRTQTGHSESEAVVYSVIYTKANFNIIRKYTNWIQLIDIQQNKVLKPPIAAHLNPQHG